MLNRFVDKILLIFLLTFVSYQNDIAVTRLNLFKSKIKFMKYEQLEKMKVINKIYGIFTKIFFFLEIKQR